MVIAPPAPLNRRSWFPHRTIRSGLAALLAVATLAACAGSTEPVEEAGAAGRVIPHALGETEISGHPNQVVALEFSFVQALDELGVSPVGIADDDNADRVTQMRGRSVDYTSVGTRLEPNLELVSELRPDLIVADETRHAAIYSQLGEIAPTIVLNSWEGSYDDIKSAVVTIAAALGDEAAGEDLVTRHEETMVDFADQIPAAEDRTFLLAVATPEDMTLHTSSSFSGSIFDILGLTSALDSTEAWESGVGLERLVAVNPDVLFVATDGPGTVLERWQATNTWSGMAAAESEMVFEVDRNQYSRFRGLHTAEVLAEDIVQMITSAEV